MSEPTRDDLRVLRRWRSGWPVDPYRMEPEYGLLSDAEFDALAREWLRERLGVDLEETREAVRTIEEWDGIENDDDPQRDLIWAERIVLSGTRSLLSLLDGGPPDE